MNAPGAGIVYPTARFPERSKITNQSDRYCKSTLSSLLNVLRMVLADGNCFSYATSPEIDPVFTGVFLVHV
jgi:hypothetical protein